MNNFMSDKLEIERILIECLVEIENLQNTLTAMKSKVKLGNIRREKINDNLTKWKTNTSTHQNSSENER